MRRWNLPYTAAHKAQSRSKILKSAANLFCRFGFDQVSLIQIMKDAAMTHGAFYAHFPSKTALYAEAIRYAARHSLLGKTDQHVLDLTSVKALVDGYLSLGHVRQITSPCPLAFLSTDVAHRETVVRESYELTFRGMVDRLMAVFSRFMDQRNAELLAKNIVVNLVGTVSIARSLMSEELQQELLNNAKANIYQLIENYEYTRPT
jgi:TetR/AcrR family transcriptional regulator, transcriptional repressor for nem operon